MRAAGRAEEVLHRRDARMRQRVREQRQSQRGGEGMPQSSLQDVPVREEAEPTKRKADETTRREEDVENQPSKKQRLVEESLMQTMASMIKHCYPKTRGGRMRLTALDMIDVLKEVPEGFANDDEPNDATSLTYVNDFLSNNAEGCYGRHQRTHKS